MKRLLTVQDRRALADQLDAAMESVREVRQIADEATARDADVALEKISLLRGFAAGLQHGPVSHSAEQPHASDIRCVHGRDAEREQIPQGKQSAPSIAESLR